MPNPSDAGSMEMLNHEATRLRNGFDNIATINGAGAALYAENLRYGYLIGKDSMSVTQSMGYRTATESGSGRARGLNS